ncbi:uncharacterized protein YALI1_E39990g [Yarrowia lipolytica]|uniref:Uncharacterized protein n=1 Tax=Yarrowia lipolytica TaxID=4952 RepID=A0A1D8NL74_YARLL|nr:hypothetical protein YALI1_E39990g [Yarrowia lipolytica]
MEASQSRCLSSSWVPISRCLNPRNKPPSPNQLKRPSRLLHPHCQKLHLRRRLQLLTLPQWNLLLQSLLCFLPLQCLLQLRQERSRTNPGLRRWPSWPNAVQSPKS